MKYISLSESLSQKIESDRVNGTVPSLAFVVSVVAGTDTATMVFANSSVGTVGSVVGGGVVGLSVPLSLQPTNRPVSKQQSRTTAIHRFVIA